MKTGLVVIDMLNDFHDGVLGNPAAAGIVEPIKSLIESARSSEEWVVIYGNDAHKPGDLEFKVFGEHAVVGSDGAAVIDDIAPKEGDEIVNKRYYSTFTETDMDSICKVHGIDRLVIVGQHTDCCVRHTSYDAYVRGIKIVVPSDATAVFAPLSDAPYEERQQAALDYLANIYGAKITTTTELLSGLNSKAD
jgi:nicotinamidase-related amidase